MARLMPIRDQRPFASFATKPNSTRRQRDFIQAAALRAIRKLGVTR